MERAIDRDPATLEPTSKPKSFMLRDAVYESLDLLRNRKISPQVLMDGFQEWEEGEGVLLSLNGSKDAFGKEVSDLGGKLSVIREGEDVIVSTFSTRPLQGKLALGFGNRLKLTDVHIVGQSQGLKYRLRVLARLQERVKPSDAQRLLDAFLHTEPPAIASSPQAI